MEKILELLQNPEIENRKLAVQLLKGSLGLNRKELKMWLFDYYMNKTKATFNEQAYQRWGSSTLKTEWFFLEATMSLRISHFPELRDYCITFYIYYDVNHTKSIHIDSNHLYPFGVREKKFKKIFNHIKNEIYKEISLIM